MHHSSSTPVFSLRSRNDFVSPIRYRKQRTEVGQVSKNTIPDFTSTGNYILYIIYLKKIE